MSRCSGSVGKRTGATALKAATACANASGSATRCRPRLNACRFGSTWTPFNSIACSIARAGSGRAPVWNATPASSMLANWSVPNRVTDNPRASMKTDSEPRVALRIRSVVASTSGNGTVLSTTIFPVGTFVVDTTAIVISGSATARFLASAATSRSQPR